MYGVYDCHKYYSTYLSLLLFFLYPRKKGELTINYTQKISLMIL